MDVNSLLKQAVKDNREDIVFYILNLSPMHKVHAFDYAIDRNNLSLLKKISQLKDFHYYPQGESSRILMDKAVKNNNIDIVKFLIEKEIYRIEDFKYWSPINIAVYNAAKYPDTHRKMLDYMLEYDSPLTANTLIQAALGENQEIIDLLVKHGAQNQIHLIEKYLKEEYMSRKGNSIFSKEDREKINKYLL